MGTTGLPFASPRGIDVKGVRLPPSLTFREIGASWVAARRHVLVVVGSGAPGLGAETVERCALGWAPFS